MVKGVPSRRGVTLLELLVVLGIVAVTLTMGIQAFSLYADRNAAQRAGEIFARDLGLARSTALRERQSVTLCLHEPEPMQYEIRTQGGRSVVIRHFGPGAPHRLSGLNFVGGGDCITFDRRGLADFGGAPGPVGSLELRSNSAVTLATFNAMGVSRMDAQ